MFWRNHSAYLLISIAANIIILLSSPCVGQTLHINCYGFHARENESTNRYLMVVSGSVLDINIKLEPWSMTDTLYNGLSTVWPEGLSFEAGTLPPEQEQLFDGLLGTFRVRSDQLIVEPGLIAQLNLQSCLSMSQNNVRTKYLKGEVVDLFDKKRHFLAYIPNILAGRTIFVRAVVDHPQWGHLVSKELIKLEIIAPRDSADVNRVRNSLINFAFFSEQYQQTIMIADSLITLGYHDVMVLEDATRAAQRAGLFDDAIRFLDLNYQMNGTTSAIDGKRYAFTPGATAAYNSYRYRLLQLKAEKEQQEQQEK